MTVVGVLAYLALGIGALLATVRLVLGPSLLDRVVAVETLLVITVAGLAVYTALYQEMTLLPTLVVVALLAFLGAVSVARYVGGLLAESPDPGSDGQDVGLPPAAETRAEGGDGGGAGGKTGTGEARAAGGDARAVGRDPRAGRKDPVAADGGEDP